jgi:predicted DNA-binding transcriptional regulator YafY
MDLNISNIIRQAAKQCQILRIIYIEADGSNDGWREVEPYSFREADGEKSLFAWDIQKNGIRRFLLERIQQAEVTVATFIPRYPVEI